MLFSPPETSIATASILWLKTQNGTKVSSSLDLGAAPAQSPSTFRASSDRTELIAANLMIDAAQSIPVLGETSASCSRFDVLGISTYAQSCCNSEPQPRHHYDNDPICTECGSGHEIKGRCVCQTTHRALSARLNVPIRAQSASILTRRAGDL